ncbi:MAG: beta strand repeat-containing protein [Croceibacterium sp.]
MDRTKLPIVPGHRRNAAFLLAGCSLAALLALSSQQAAAQSFNGTSSVVAGAADVTTGPGTTTITVKAPETVIDWFSFADVDPNAINFQQVGTTATFVDGAAGLPLNYTVLNRIMPLNGNSEPTAATVAFNGTVNSIVGGKQGGNVWFYSPIGIIVGPTAAFNVGSLILTTNDVVIGAANTGGSELYGPNNTVMFRGPAGSVGFVDVQASSTINASSYVALVAPRVQQGGTISADGPIGYVGAEQADISINAGLFDISIGVGTTDANGIVHTGTTTGPASTSSADVQQIFMVAMPKATALTMLLSGSIGYTPAASAVAEGSSVILSAGYQKPVPTADSASALGNIAIDNAVFQNALNAYATHDINVTASGGPVGFGGDSLLFGQHAVDFALGASETITAAGSLTLDAGKDGAGGNIDVTLGPKASLIVNGYLDLNAESYAIPYFSAFAGGDSSGGNITIVANGGTLSATSLFADASAVSWPDPVVRGNSSAGSVSITSRNGGSITATDLSMYADAEGGNSGNVAGDASAGTLSLSGIGGSLIFDTVRLEATALGGTGSVLSGAAVGGKASILLDAGSYIWKSLDVVTDAISTFDATTPGAKGNGASGLSDAISLTVTNGAELTIASDINLSSNATATANAPAGANALGGHIVTTVDPGATLSFVNFNANADANVTYPSVLATAPLTTPDATGGRIDFTASGNLIGSAISLSADASGLGASSSAGTAHGGTITALVNNGGNLSLDDGSGTSSLDLHANGFGAIGQSAANAFGGSATLTVSDATAIVNGTISVSASARANDIAFFYPSGSNPVGFDATGGTATAQLLPGLAGTASLTATSLTVDSGGNAATPTFFYPGGEFGPPGNYSGPFAANGGTGTGGSSALGIGAGNFTVGTVMVGANGSGGVSSTSSGATPFRSGDGVGGTAGVAITGGTSTITGLTISADGFGGGGSPSGGSGELGALAGNGFGSNASLTISGGTLQATTLTVDASGTGGDGTDDGSGGNATDGGSGKGGTARLVTTPGGNGQLTSNSVSVLAKGTGGLGGTSSGVSGNGGHGTGGTAAAQLADGAFSLGPVTISADGTGGDGAVGGVGSGGSAQFALVDTTGPTGARTLGPLNLNASGIGGTGTGGVAASDAGSTKLDVEVANAAAALTVGGDFNAIARGSNAAPGDGFNGKVTGGLFRVNGNVTIDTSRDVTIAAGSGIHADSNLTVLARSFTETGLLSSGSKMSITAPQGITADQLRSDSIGVDLTAVSGAINVANLTSFDVVNALGRSIDIADGGRLIIASAQATAGDLSITPFGNLFVQSASATGSMTLSSTAGNGIVSATGPVSAGGSFTSSGGNGVTFGTITAGGPVSLISANGAITVSDLISAGLVTASGHSIDISSSGALAFTAANASAGNLNIDTAGNLAVQDGSATGTVTLSSSGGTISSSGLISSGGAFSASGATGLNFASLSSGGTTTLSAPGGAAVVTTDLESVGNLTVTGRSIDLNSFGDLAFANVQATAGALQVTATGNLQFAQASATGAIGMTSSAGSLTATGPITAGGTVNLSAAGGIGLGSLTSGGTTLLDGGVGALTVTDLISPGAVTATARSIDIGSTGGLTFTSLTATGGGARVATAGDLSLVGGTSTGALTLTSANGSVTSAGTVAAGGAVSANGKTGLDFNRLTSGGTTSLISSNGPVHVALLSSAGLVTASGASIDIGSSEALRFDSVNALNTVTITAAGDLAFGTVNAGSFLTLNSTGGALTATGSITGGFTDLRAANGIDLGGDLAVAGDLTIQTPGMFRVGGATHADDTHIVADGGISLALLTSGEVTSLDAAAGNIVVGDLETGGRVGARGRDVHIVSLAGGLNFDEATATAGNVFIRTVGDLNTQIVSASNAVDLASSAGAIHAVGDVTGATIALAAGGNVLADANLTSAGALGVDAGGTFGLLGTARGTTIGVRSSDIQLGTAAKLGVRGTTQSVTLTSRDAARPTFIGGDPQGGGYSLDSAEAARVFADRSITLAAAGNAVIGNLQLSYGGTGNVGTGGLIEVTSPANVEVSGAVDLATSSADDTFRIDPVRIDVIAGEGSIAMHSGGAVPQGTIDLIADTVAVADRATLSAIDGLTDTRQISLLLDAPAAAGPPGGYLQAGTIRVTAADAFLVQNGGTSPAYAARRGFTADALDIVTGSAATRIAINGVILQNGAPLLGLAVTPLVTINGKAAAAGGQFDPLSTINGCIIGQGCAPVAGTNPPTNGDLDHPVTPGNPGEGAPTGALVGIEDNQPLISPPLVDEPITGVGNDDLWLLQCDPKQEGCPQRDSAK